jgi:hypothetical protein
MCCALMAESPSSVPSRNNRCEARVPWYVTKRQTTLSSVWSDPRLYNPAYMRSQRDFESAFEGKYQKYPRRSGPKANGSANRHDITACILSVSTGTELPHGLPAEAVAVAVDEELFLQVPASEANFPNLSSRSKRRHGSRRATGTAGEWRTLSCA